MATAVNITDALGSIPEERRLGPSTISWIEADPRADVVAESKISEFVKDIPFLQTPSQEFQIPSALRPPSDLSTAFGRMLDEVKFRDKLETFTEEIGRTKEAEVYLVRWSALMNAFIDKAFTVRALLEAAIASDDLEFDRAAANEMGRMSKMMEGAPLAFQRHVEDELGASWAYNLVGMQLERINQPMNMVGAYPQLIKKYSGEELKQWRKTAIQELSRLTDITTYLRGIESYKGYSSTLTIDLPKKAVDLFVAHPKQGLIDLEAVKANARSFHYVWAALTEIVLEAGRKSDVESKIRIDYSQTMGAILVQDKKPTLRGALYPFVTEPPKSRLYSLVDRMGQGSKLHRKKSTVARYRLMNGEEMKVETIGTIVIELPDVLAPDRKMTLEEAAEARVATKIDIGGERVAMVDHDSEDSGVNPMATLFVQERAEAKSQPTEFSGIVRQVSEPPAATVRGADIFAEIADEVAAEEAAALKAQEIAAHSTTGVIAAVAPALLKT